MSPVSSEKLWFFHDFRGIEIDEFTQICLILPAKFWNDTLQILDNSNEGKTSHGKPSFD